MIKKIFGSLAITSLFAGPLLVACGSSSGIDSGVDGSKTGADLTTDEVQSVCNAIVEYGQDSAEKITKEDTCKFAGYSAAGITAALTPNATDADLQAACDAAVKDCVEAPDQGAGGAPSDENPCDSVTSAVTTECEATVADIESCSTERIDASVEASTALFDAIPACGSITRELLSQQPEQPEEPEDTQSAACDNIDEKCKILNQFPGFGGGVPGGGGDDLGAGGGQ